MEGKKLYEHLEELVAIEAGLKVNPDNVEAIRRRDVILQPLQRVSVDDLIKIYQQMKQRERDKDAVIVDAVEKHRKEYKADILAAVEEQCPQAYSVVEKVLEENEGK
ncbi:hypothetical protein KY316_03010 [Candidatus Woesearchaeota archaeon]|nr:hypothetical protein [Candidatus Woesearchaeota archaeon]